MRPASWWLSCLALLASGLASSIEAAAQASADTEESGIEVMVTEPSFLRPVFGEVTIEAKVVSEEEIVRVEFFLDGESIGVIDREPYRLLHDVGQENREHRFRAVARDVSGRTGVGEVDTPAIQVDDLIDLELQQLYVTATRGGVRALDLGREDFEVRDNGGLQKLVTFERGEVPMTAVLLIDVSRSMEGERLGSAMRGAGVFLGGLQPLDEAMVMLFSDELVRATEFTNDPEVLLAALEGVEAIGGTALNDHLYMALNYLDGRQGRRVIVVLSDGVDLFSVLRMRDVLWRARRSQALIYWIHLGDLDLDAGQGSAWRNVSSNAKEFEMLHEAIEQSGGRVEFPRTGAELESAYEEILQELREQYVLGYYPTNLRGDGSWREVKVKPRRSGVSVRCREGYVDF